MLMVNDGCRRSVVVTEGLWLSQSVCGFHRGYVDWLSQRVEGLWLSQRVCGCHRGSVVVTEGLWLSQRGCGFHRGSVVFTEGLWFSQRVMGGERPVSWGVVMFAIKR